MAPFLHNNQSCLCTQDQWVSWDIQNDSDHWIFHSSQHEDQFWSPDHGRDHPESTICKGELLPLSKVPPDCPRAQTN